ncbi:L-dopachrome tautomerase-related protein [Lichenicoccus sp.]|uniref:L-dopachrome tautomerase-related protein n=1 Tax=Lichenicoccus sp. TaxID=2781899 RepID=UPI003D149D27
MTIAKLLACAALLLATMAAAPDRLRSIAQTDRLAWSGVARSDDGRTFVVFSRLAGNPGPSLAVIGNDGKPQPFPGGGWNDWSAAADKADPAKVFVGLSAIRLGPDHSLWVLDSGVADRGRALAGAAKLVRIDLVHDSVARTIVLPADVLRPKSRVADFCLHGTTAYIADAGAPGLIVLDLTTGAARRVLDGTPSMTARRPVTVDGETLRGADGKPVMIDVDNLDLSPDGKFLYYQPLSGPMSRIATSLLDDPKATPQALTAGVEFWYDTPALGGSAIAPDGTLYLDDVENDSVLSLSPDRALRTVISDPRLHWPAAPFLRDGVLTIPVSQFDRAGLFHHGHSRIAHPVELFELRVASAPAAASPPKARR